MQYPGTAFHPPGTHPQSGTRAPAYRLPSVVFGPLLLSHLFEAEPTHLPGVKAAMPSMRQQSTSSPAVMQRLSQQHQTHNVCSPESCFTWPEADPEKGTVLTQREGEQEEEASPQGEDQRTGSPAWRYPHRRAPVMGSPVVPNPESHWEPSERAGHSAGQVRPLVVGGALLSPGLPGRPPQQPPD